MFGPGFQDRAATALAFLNDDYAAVASIRAAALKRKIAEEEAAARGELMNELRPKAQAYNGMAGPTMDGSEPSAQVIPEGQREARMPGLRQVSPALIAAAAKGVDISPFLDTLKAVEPDLQFVNGVGVDARDPKNIGKRIGVNLANVDGWQVDQQDPGNAGKFFGKPPAPGAEPAFNQRGEHIGWRMSNGAIQAIEAAAGAEAGAKARAEAPYEFVNVPTPTGAPATASKAYAAGKGLFTGQSPREAREETLRADQQVQREGEVRSGEGQLRILKEADELLNDAITGFGADIRLQGERALALTGDKKAQKRVAATETFRSTMSRQVLDLVKQLGAGTSISNADRDFAAKVAGGEISLNKETIRKLMDIQRREIEAKRSSLAQPTRPTGGAAGVRTQGQGFKIVGVRN